jgi:ketosteroid isomerase-like protein
MANSRVSPEARQKLETKLQMMTQAMMSGDSATVAAIYTDDAVLTDLKDFRAEGRDAIDRHWLELSRYLDWQLRPLETGGDAETPYQRLHSIAHLSLKGKTYVDEGYCFVVWKRGSDGEYRIYVDIYHPLKFGPIE